MAIASGFYLLIGIFYFAAKRKSYSHFKHTISELGERGAPQAKAVNYGIFLPVGLVLFLNAILANAESIQGLSFCLAFGYTVASFFPCDPGSPWSGSGSQQIHNLGGFVEYAGGLYFINQANENVLMFLDAKVITVILLVCIILISIPGFSLRGFAQRVAEILLFGSLTYLSLTSGKG